MGVLPQNPSATSEASRGVADVLPGGPPVDAAADDPAEVGLVEQPEDRRQVGSTSSRPGRPGSRCRTGAAGRPRPGGRCGGRRSSADRHRRRRGDHRRGAGVHRLGLGLGLRLAARARGPAVDPGSGSVTGAAGADVVGGAVVGGSVTGGAVVGGAVVVVASSSSTSAPAPPGCPTGAARAGAGGPRSGRHDDLGRATGRVGGEEDAAGEEQGGGAERLAERACGERHGPASTVAMAPCIGLG